MPEIVIVVARQSSYYSNPVVCYDKRSTNIPM